MICLASAVSSCFHIGIHGTRLLSYLQLLTESLSNRFPRSSRLRWSQSAGRLVQAKQCSRRGRDVCSETIVRVEGFERGVRFLARSMYHEQNAARTSYLGHITYSTASTPNPIVWHSPSNADTGSLLHIINHGYRSSTVNARRSHPGARSMPKTNILPNTTTPSSGSTHRSTDPLPSYPCHQAPPISTTSASPRSARRAQTRRNSQTTYFVKRDHGVQFLWRSFGLPGRAGPRDENHVYLLSADRVSTLFTLGRVMMMIGDGCCPTRATKAMWLGTRPMNGYSAEGGWLRVVLYRALRLGIEGRRMGSCWTIRSALGFGW